MVMRVPNGVYLSWISFTVTLACVASVSSRVIARKLEREQKKNGRGRGGEKKKNLLSPSPLGRPDTRSVTHVDKTYLVWLMYWLLFNQHYQHRTNQKLRSWANAVFQNRGVCGQAFPSLPSPSPSFLFFFFALVPTFSTNSRGNACYAGYRYLNHVHRPLSPCKW